MTETRTVSLAIPTFQREDLLFESFANVYDDPRISEIIIVDDASDLELFNRVKEKCDKLSKVRLFRNIFNIDCYRNKHRAFSFINNEYGILLDSDNVITKEYLDAIYAIPEWNAKTILQPVFAKPAFDFRQYSGLTLTKENVAHYVDTNLMTSLNAMNFFINRDEYLKVWDGSVDAGSSDSIYFSLCWLKAGNSILMTPNLHYDHRIHEDKSNHYSQNSHKYVEFHNQVMKEIKELK